eukprot:TRINITY_DN977_c0_g4_i1.p1 TRINITY_DN977_c0_g4~~TRINITY_DN977_c0_g4_i1.p1  ORF type:complete len:266 (+),score=40.49 TRINITY_DN977_c0_g4_i1:274-1071(+)
MLHLHTVIAFVCLTASVRAAQFSIGDVVPVSEKTSFASRVTDAHLLAQHLSPVFGRDKTVLLHRDRSVWASLVSSVVNTTDGANRASGAELKIQLLIGGGTALRTPWIPVHTVACATMDAARAAAATAAGLPDDANESRSSRARAFASGAAAIPALARGYDAHDMNHRDHDRRECRYLQDLEVLLTYEPHTLRTVTRVQAVPTLGDAFTETVTVRYRWHMLHDVDPVGAQTALAVGGFVVACVMILRAFALTPSVRSGRMLVRTS